MKSELSFQFTESSIDLHDQAHDSESLMDFEKYIESKLKSVDKENQISTFLSPGSLDLSNIPSNIPSKEPTPVHDFNKRQ